MGRFRRFFQALSSSYIHGFRTTKRRNNQKIVMLSKISGLALFLCVGTMAMKSGDNRGGNPTELTEDEREFQRIQDVLKGDLNDIMGENTPGAQKRRDIGIVYDAFVKRCTELESLGYNKWTLMYFHTIVIKPLLKMTFR